MLEFDPVKDADNLRKHGISLGRFADMDETTWLSARDDRRDYGEERIFFGLIDEILYCAVITIRGENHRIISLRQASRRERELYAKTNAEQP